MESPVRICLGAALVVSVLLISSTKGTAAEPATSTSRTPRFARVNATTWIPRNRTRVPDAALNELKPKSPEEDGKYKQRGRVRFGTPTRTTVEARRTKPTIAPKTEPTIMIVTPTPPKKNMTEIIANMRSYRNKMSSSSTTPANSDEDDDDSSDEFDKFTDTNFFSIPSFDDDSQSNEDDSDKQTSNTYGTFSSYFPSFYTTKDTKSYHHFDDELTTPKNDYFDRKFHQISNSIRKNLASIKTTVPTKDQLQKVVKEKVNVNPTNKSTVFFKNTKEIRVLDNDSAGTSKTELSDVQGTSIYYEMSVLSTETYALENSNEDDCDDAPEPTAPTKDDPPVRTTSPTFPRPTKPTYVSPTLPTRSLLPSSVKTKTVSPNSIQNEATTILPRNGFPKRLNFTAPKTANTTKTDQVGSNQVLRTSTRKFHFTTPKNKVWIAPRRNITRTYARTTPSTVYSEYYEAKNQTTSKLRMPNKTVVTTVSSDIDPVLQSEISGVKKIVHSQSITDNSIPTLWKRGSTKFSSSTVAPTVGDASDLEIPPTLTAWALAGLRSPPVFHAANATSSPKDDENELQDVNDLVDVKSSTEATTTDSSEATLRVINDLTSTAQVPTVEEDSNAAETNQESQAADTTFTVQSPTEEPTIKPTATNTIAPSSNRGSIKHRGNAETTTESQDDIEIKTPSTTKSTRFESITKLPSGVTTPQGDEPDKREEKTEVQTESTTDYQITTIRFTYVPTITEATTEAEVATTESPTTVKPIEDVPITTYRPVYMTTTESEETTVEETTPFMVELSTKEAEQVQTTTEEATTLKTETTEMPKEEETTIMTVEVVTEINTETQTQVITTTERDVKETTTEDQRTNNELTTKETTVMTTKPEVTTEVLDTTKAETTTVESQTTTVKIESETEIEVTTQTNDIEDTTIPELEATTEAYPIVSPEEAGSGVAIAIAVSTIGVIALILLVGLLLVVRRRGRRGVYAQRCKPVSLDAYSLDSVSVGHRKGNQRLRASKRSYGNPAYDDEVTSHPMQYAALSSFASDMESITAEFTEIPSVTVRPDEVPPGCEDKNRYSNVLPLPETRVPLLRVGSDPTSEYINANYVTGPGNIKNYYIACQAPLHNTVSDLWRMIWEQNSRLIVMLTDYTESGVEKCFEYLPPSEVSDNKRIFGDYQVVLKTREQRDKYAISTIQLINMRTRSWREVVHMWYFWPVKGVPDDFDSVIDFLSEMRGFMKMAQTAKEYDEDGVEVIYGDQNRSSYNNLTKFRGEENAHGNGVNVYSPQKAEELMRRSATNNGTLGRMKAASEVEGVRPCVVICASGAGRSAAIIALDICARALAAGVVDVPRVVRELRAQRPHSLTNRHHYIFLYKVLSEYGNKLMGVGVDTI